ncbi:ribokinase [Thermostilla marina]
MQPVVVLGSVNVDLTVQAPRLPSPGETVLGGAFYRSFGGKGANQAVAAARLALAPVVFLGCVGDDDNGLAALRALQQENLDCRHVRTIPDTATGVAVILVDEHGENMIAVASGANLCLDISFVQSLPDEVFPANGVFLACGELCADAVAVALARAKACGLTTIFNPAPTIPDWAEPALLRNVDILTPNEVETLQMAAAAGVETSALDEAVDSILSRGVRQLIVTRGADGAMLRGQVEGTVPAPHVQAVDTTAAGDAFNGALAVALAEGSALDDAVRFAVKAASISVTRKGAQPSLPRRAEIDLR